MGQVPPRGEAVAIGTGTFVPLENVAKGTRVTTSGTNVPVPIATPIATRN